MNNTYLTFMNELGRLTAEMPAETPLLLTASFKRDDDSALKWHQMIVFLNMESDLELEVSKWTRQPPHPPAYTRGLVLRMLAEIQSLRGQLAIMQQSDVHRVEASELPPPRA